MSSRTAKEEIEADNYILDKLIFQKRYYQYVTTFNSSKGRCARVRSNRDKIAHLLEILKLLQVEVIEVDPTNPVRPQNSLKNIHKNPQVF